MSGEVEQVSNNLNQLRTGDDFSGVSEEIRDLQRNDNANWRSNIAEINRNVDMRSLGFDEDFKILGVNGQGKLVTESEDGRSIQLRDRTHMEVQSEEPNMRSTQQWGHRQFDASPDGTASYMVKRGDNLWRIAKDTLTEQLGRAPKDSEIATQVKDIARENELKDPNKIYAGKELKIPMARPYGELPPREQPSLNPGDAFPQTQGDASNSVFPPGLASDGPGATDGNVSERNIVGRERTEGMTTTRYEGSLDDGILGLGRTQFQAERTTAQNGALLSSRIEYEGSGANIKFADVDGGTRELQSVKSIATVFNSEAGNYETTITSANGAKYRSVTSADGQIVSLRQVAEPDTTENIPLF